MNIYLSINDVRHNLNKGFTLIELIITVAILGIIAAVAIPAYDSQKRKGFRSDAIILLTTAAQLQERYYSENAAYTNVLTTLTPTGVTTSPEEKYNLTIESYSSSTYNMVATATGGQTQDTNCLVFKLSHTGVRSATSSSCWPK